MVRIIARDHSIPEGGEFAQVGTISIPSEYFKNVPEPSYGQVFSQWLTLFDEVDDDEFDGELGEDDDEEPKIRT